MYVETSAINNDSRSTNSAFEVSFSSEFIFRQISNKSQRRLLAWPPLGNSQGRHLHRGLSRGVGLAGGRQVNQGEDIWVLTHLDVLITRCSGGRVRLNCLAAMGGERGEKYQQGRGRGENMQGRGRGENYQHLDLISNQSRSGSISSVCNTIIVTTTFTVSHQVSLQSKSSTLSSTTSETSSSERRASSSRASSSMVGSSAVSSPALSSATLASGSSPVLKVNTLIIVSSTFKQF